WPAVERRLRNGDEWPQVVAAGLRYIQQLCLQEAGPAVLDVLRRGLRPEAWPPDVDLAALAADLALTLGGETAAEARTVGGRATAPAVVRAAIERHRGGRCGD
ncbi:MAG: hypothetical protein IT378_09925, partial [Sandaracinaceae bacterium]|nr:hypothetical protein [Sandaracinaceae bacterium]